MKMTSANSRRITFSTIFAIITVLITLTGCDILGTIAKKAIDEFTNIGNNTNTTLEQAAQELNANASNYANIMQRAIDAIDDANIKRQLQDALDNAIVTGSTEIRCDTRFTVDYLIARIDTILADINKQDPPVKVPFVCNVLPPQIDMSLSPNERNVVTITGYFLGEEFQNYNLSLISTSGSISNQTSELSKSSDFKLTIDFGSSGIQLNDYVDKIVLSWNRNVLTDIPVIQAIPEPCRLQEWTLTDLPKLVMYPEHKKSPWAKKGDKEFKDNGPCTRGSISVFTRNNSTELWARGTVKMWECPDDFNKIKPDYTYGDQTKELKIHHASIGWRINKINEATYDTFQNIDKEEDRTERVSGSGPVSSYLIQGDTDGDDLGNSRVEVTFKPIKVTLEEMGDCIRN